MFASLIFLTSSWYENYNINFNTTLEDDPPIYNKAFYYVLPVILSVILVIKMFQLSGSVELYEDNEEESINEKNLSPVQNKEFDI